MTEQPAQPRLHHVVFAVSHERHDTAAEMFADVGFSFEEAELAEHGLHIHLDWNGGLELISPVPDSTAAVAASVQEFLDGGGDGVYTVVLRVPEATAAEATTNRYGSSTRFRQSFSGEGSYLDEIELSVSGLPLTFLSTNIQ